MQPEALGTPDFLVVLVLHIGSRLTLGIHDGLSRPQAWVAPTRSGMGLCVYL